MTPTNSATREAAALAAGCYREACLHIRFDVGSATTLPYPDATQDVVLLPQLLEHVPDCSIVFPVKQ